jgi:hypothetical protein
MAEVRDYGAMAEPYRGIQIWRVRWWVRALSIAVLLPPSLIVFAPARLNPTWAAGVPADQWAWLAVIYAVLFVLAWTAFYSRVELNDGHVRVVNPWGTRTFQASEVANVQPGPYGVEFLLFSGSKVAAYAIQCAWVSAGPEPRWVGVAKAVTGRDPR